MAIRWQLTAVTLCLILVAPSLLHADIYRWDTGEVIPGTEGIEPGPGLTLDHRELAFANLSSGWDPGDVKDLTGASFELSNLTNAWLSYSRLTNANLTGANLTNARLHQSTLTSANLTGALITGINLGNTTPRGFTKWQLYSTASYRAKDLRGIVLSGNDLAGWNFSGQNLTNGGLTQSNLTGTNLTGATVMGAGLIDVTSRGFTKEQLYSTASYGRTWRRCRNPERGRCR